MRWNTSTRRTGSMTSIMRFMLIRSGLAYLKLNKGLFCIHWKPLEERRVQKCTSKRYVPKIMFMATVARPRYDVHTKSWFAGLIGIWSFTTKKDAERISYKGKEGTIEMVAIKNVTKFEHERMLVDNAIPAIKTKFPSRCKNRPLYIQLDNARPHTVCVDELIEQLNRWWNNGWNIQIKRQPPNSPDMNILDLGIFKHLQSLMDRKSPKSADGHNGERLLLRPGQYSWKLFSFVATGNDWNTGSEGRQHVSIKAHGKGENETNRVQE